MDASEWLATLHAFPEMQIHFVTATEPQLLAKSRSFATLRADPRQRAGEDSMPTGARSRLAGRGPRGLLRLLQLLQLLLLVEPLGHLQTLLR